MFIRALQYRTNNNTHGTRVALNQATKTVGCELQAMSSELRNHPPGHQNSKNRSTNNEIVRVVQERGLTVKREQSIVLWGQLDYLIVVRDDLDVMVVFGNRNCISEAAVRKINSYRTLLPQLQRLHNRTKEKLSLWLLERGGTS